MGPPISIDGKTISREIASSAGTLQWGRRLASTERRDFVRSPDKPGALQWGRRLASTERLARPFRTQLQRHASMGPPISIDGKARRGRDARRSGGASMGPPISIDGKSARRAGYRRG